MNFFINMYTTTKKRISNTPVTAIFLIIGFTLSMLIISVAVSFVSEILNAQEENEKAQPPNGTQYILSWSEEDRCAEFGKIFQGISSDSGIIINGLMVNVDDNGVNTYTPVSAEWFWEDEGWKYPLTDGRYYTVEEIQSGEKVALIGKKYIKYIYTENNIDYIDIENEKYEVIGVVGLAGQSSFWDARVFMPCTALPESIMQQIESERCINCILYSSSGAILDNEQRIKENIFYLFKKSQFSYIGLLEMEDIAGSLANSGEMLFTIAIVGYLVSIIYAVNIVVFWIEKRRKEIAVRKALGYTNRDIIKLLLSEMIGLSLISCVLAILLQLVMGVYAESIVGYTLRIYESNIIVGMIVIALTAFITSILPICKTLKIQPIEIIRKG